MTIAFVTLGCKLNYAETATYARGFKAAGFEPVPWSKGADLFVVNTCSVTATSDSKSRSVIRKLHRIRPEAPIVVTGCYAELRRAEVEAIEGVTLVFGAGEKARLVPETLAFLTRGEPSLQAGTVSANASLRSAPPFASLSVPPLMVPRVAQFSDTAPACNDDRTSDRQGGHVFGAYSIGGRTRSFLKVQDGCDNYCAYCTVPFARGHSRNIPVAEVLCQARAIAASGAKEIVLTGVNTGDFGRSTGESFLSLLQALNEVEGIERYRISSIEPNLITEDIVDWIASGTKFLPHFHIPLQAGTDELLHRMGRRYTTAFFKDRLDYIRARMEGPGHPKVFFGIDIMAGLPGETDELFAQGLAFVESVRPAFLHVFPYSRRPGTRAAAWPDQVPEAVKAGRVKALEALSDRLHADFIAANRGIRERVLWESKEKDGTMSGFTGNYIKISRPYEAGLGGTITEVVI